MATVSSQLLVRPTLHLTQIYDHVSVPIWKRHRKIIMPAFNQKILDGFVEVFGRQSTTMCSQLEKHVDEEFDLFDVVSKCSLDILCGTTYHYQSTKISFVL